MGDCLAFIAKEAKIDLAEKAYMTLSEQDYCKEGVMVEGLSAKTLAFSIPNITI